jgi:hypothetical protein
MPVLMVMLCCGVDRSGLGVATAGGVGRHQD